MNAEPVSFSSAQKNDERECTEALSYRYPGARSFSDNGVDHRLFFGREQERQELLHQVRGSRLLVVFGKSGLGKTSLLQAGLYPYLREQALLPVPVRLDQKGVSPIRAVLKSVGVVCAEFGVDYESRKAEGLWEFFKGTDFWRGEILQTPVLVFDQFEEIFTLRSKEDRTELAAALGELVSGGLPPRIKKHLTPGERPTYSHSAPHVKIILSLREEYIGALEQLVPKMPSIFGHRFQLRPLMKEFAEKAVIEPASFPETQRLRTQPFTFDPHALQTIMDFLVNRQGEVEPFQLQIICGHIERRVENQQCHGAQNVVVDEGLVGGCDAMEGLLHNFYRDALHTLPMWPVPFQRWTARLLCENGLVSPDGHRISMEEGQIRKQFKTLESSLKILTAARLLRKESRPGLDGFYYELSHDSLTEPIMKNRKSRGWFLRLALTIALLISGVTTWLWQKGYTELQALLKIQSMMMSIHQEPKMVLIPGGVFQQGSNTGVRDERPVRSVTIRSFEIGQYEVTFEEYDRFAVSMGRELPGDQGWGRGQRPVINVTWDDAKAYANWLSEQTGKPYRLLSESEWEYVARSGAKQEIFMGTNEEPQLPEYAFYVENSGSRTAEVGSKRANDLGIQDMAGNVWEWVEDCWHADYKEAPTDGRAWLDAEGSDCLRRVVRGGSWLNTPEFLRASNRGRYSRDFRLNYLGFRLARDTR